MVATLSSSPNTRVDFPPGACNALRWGRGCVADEAPPDLPASEPALISSGKFPPKTSLLAPPGGTPSVRFASGSKEPPPRITVELPPGACWNLVGTSGASCSAAFFSLFRASKISALSSIPRMTEAFPPTGPRSVTESAVVGDVSKLSAASPPGPCVKRGHGLGVTTTASLAACLSIKMSFELSKPSTMVASPPTAPLHTAASTSLVASQLSCKELSPPGICWKRRGGSAPSATVAAACSLASNSKISLGSSEPSTTLGALPEEPPRPSLSTMLPD
mmetsp:Transcript_55220/g.131629  ORF Transcript_55220/g.131629 Transcript_55220/m.131629 type:complete len:276 (-) Transcript_55220:1362-2189(-)